MLEILVIKVFFQASIRNEIKKKIAKIIGWYHFRYSASLESSEIDSKLFSEKKVVPVVAVLFIMIYWGAAINLYLGK